MPAPAMVGDYVMAPNPHDPLAVFRMVAAEPPRDLPPLESGSVADFNAAQAAGRPVSLAGLARAIVSERQAATPPATPTPRLASRAMPARATTPKRSATTRRSNNPPAI
jgi:hypothetical protein